MHVSKVTFYNSQQSYSGKYVKGGMKRLYGRTSHIPSDGVYECVDGRVGWERNDNILYCGPPTFFHSHWVYLLLMTHYSIYIIQYKTTNNPDNSLMTAMCCKLLATSLFSVHALAPSSFHSWKGILYFISLKVQVARIYLNSCL